jgi:hypothetical protein
MKRILVGFLIALGALSAHAVFTVDLSVQEENRLAGSFEFRMGDDEINQEFALGDGMLRIVFMSTGYTSGDYGNGVDWSIEFQPPSDGWDWEDGFFACFPGPNSEAMFMGQFGETPDHLDRPFTDGYLYSDSFSWEIDTKTGVVTGDFEYSRRLPAPDAGSTIAMLLVGCASLLAARRKPVG